VLPRAGWFDADGSPNAVGSYDGPDGDRVDQVGHGG